jgi:hypothetical protein
MENMAPLGPWIRSNQFGRRIMEEKDRKFHSNPSQSRSYGQYSPPIPASMLAQMKAMKIQEEQAAESSTPPQTRQQPYEGGERSTLHRTNRNNTQTSGLMELNTTPTEQTMVKRPRIDEAGEECTNNQMAGPAGQASQAA